MEAYCLKGVDVLQLVPHGVNLGDELLPLMLKGIQKELLIQVANKEIPE